MREQMIHIPEQHYRLKNSLIAKYTKGKLEELGIKCTIGDVEE